ncbi:MAG: hypothetical protein Q9170_000990 [Blastenia crenularia]
MEKPVDPEMPLTILHHDEHLVFPGYDVMIGKGCVGQVKKDERDQWALRNLLGMVNDLENKLRLRASQPSTTTAISFRPKARPSAVVKPSQVGHPVKLIERQLLEQCMFADQEAALKADVYGAAAGDLSPMLSAGFCDGSQNTTTPQYDMGEWYVFWLPKLATSLP